MLHGSREIVAASLGLFFHMSNGQRRLFVAMKKSMHIFSSCIDCKGQILTACMIACLIIRNILDRWFFYFALNVVAGRHAESLLYTLRRKGCSAMAQPESVTTNPDSTASACAFPLLDLALIVHWYSCARPCDNTDIQAAKVTESIHFSFF